LKNKIQCIPRFSRPSSPLPARRWTMEARIAAWDAILGARRVRRLHKTSVSLPSTPKPSMSSLFAKEDAAAALLAALAKKSEVEAATKAAAAIISLKHQLDERKREARRERYQKENAAPAAALPPRRMGLLKIGDAHVRTLRQVLGVAPRVATERREIHGITGCDSRCTPHLSLGTNDSQSVHGRRTVGSGRDAHSLPTLAPSPPPQPRPPHLPNPHRPLPVLPPILAHVLSPDALRVKRETYLRRLRREDTVRRLAYAPTQAESAPLAFKLSTSRRTNMSLLTFDF
jgi:hypothetical protein